MLPTTVCSAAVRMVRARQEEPGDDEGRIGPAEIRPAPGTGADGESVGRDAWMGGCRGAIDGPIVRCPPPRSNLCVRR